METNYRKTLKELPAYAKPGCTWGQAHLNAIAAPRDGYERALNEMISGWLRYADAVRDAWDSGVGSDYVLGPCWAQIGSQLRGLLNGDLGRMDGETLDGVLCNALTAEGFDPDTL